MTQDLKSRQKAKFDVLLGENVVRPRHCRATKVKTPRSKPKKQEETSGLAGLRQLSFRRYSAAIVRVGAKASQLKARTSLAGAAPQVGQRDGKYLLSGKGLFHGWEIMPISPIRETGQF